MFRKWTSNRDGLLGPEAARVAAVAGRSLVVSLSFWTAVCLPFLLGALAVSGIDTRAEAGAFLVLTAVEILALFGGRPYAAR